MKRTTHLIAATLAVLLPACAATTVDTPQGHPANPKSETTPIVLSPLLTTSAARATEPVAEPAGHHHHHADSPAAAEVWTCSMHPEVTKSGPGKCPICGMNLVKRAEGKDAQ